MATLIRIVTFILGLLKLITGDKENKQSALQEKAKQEWQKKEIELKGKLDEAMHNYVVAIANNSSNHVAFYDAWQLCATNYKTHCDRGLEAGYISRPQCAG